MRSTTFLAWAPLRHRVFGAIWFAILISNIGTWMQTVGAQWLLVDEPDAPTLVALVSAAETLPVLLLSLPIGVLAEYLDRRVMLIIVQGFQVVVAGVLTVLVYVGGVGPLALLAFTFALGAGAAAQTSIYLALIPELVPRQQLPQASALGAIGLNIARVIGPTIAGLVIAHLGVGAVFLTNAATFVFVAIVLLCWRDFRPIPVAREPFFTSLVAGARYVAGSKTMRRLLLRLAIFLLPANAVWALLPVVAAHELGLGASGYGLLLGSLGVGSLIGALLLPWIRARLTLHRIFMVVGGVFAILLIMMVLVPNVFVIVPVLVVSGAVWLVTLATTGATAQLQLPPWVRARGLSIYQLVLFGSLVAGATVWSVVVRLGLAPALLIAAALLLLGVLCAPTLALDEIPHDPDEVGRD